MTTYLANLDFDARVAGKAGGAQPRPGPADENAVLWRVVAEEGDEILVPGLKSAFDAKAVGPLARVHFRPPDMKGEDRFVPWGDDSLAQRLACGGISERQLQATIRLNDRLFAFELDRLPAAFFTDEPSDVLRRAAAGERLMLKPRFGGFGRGLRRVLGVEQDENLRGWVRSRCRDGGLIVEPLIERFVCEWGSHWEICELSTGSAQARSIGETELKCDVHGQFVGSAFRFDGNDKCADDAASAERVEEAAAKSIPREIVESGYRGPLSIDRCVYTWDGCERIGWYRDINARWSVGRLVLTLGQRMKTDVSIERRSTATSDHQHVGSDRATCVIPPLTADARPRWRLEWKS